MKKLDKYKLNYVFEIGANAKTKTNQIHASLSRIKEYRVTNYEGSIILISEENDKMFKYNLNETQISIEMYTNNVVENPKKELLLKLFEILSHCNWQFDIDLSCLYAYLVESFTKNQLNYYSNTIKEKYSKEYSDIVLAKRIIDLRKKNTILEDNVSKIRNKLSRVAPDVIITRFSHESTISEIMGYTGLDKNEVNAALSELPNMGYKVMSSRSNKLNVVKI